MGPVPASRAAAVSAGWPDGCQSAKRKRSHTAAAGTDSRQQQAPGASHTVRLSAPISHCREKLWQSNHCLAVTLCIQRWDFPRRVKESCNQSIPGQTYGKLNCQLALLVHLSTVGKKQAQPEDTITCMTNIRPHRKVPEPSNTAASPAFTPNT